MELLAIGLSAACLLFWVIIYWFEKGDGQKH